MKKKLKILLIVIIYFLAVFIILEKTNVISVKKIINIKSVDEYIDNGLTLSDGNLSHSNGTEDTYYYDQLGETAKIIYDKFLKEKDKLKTGTESIRFTNHEFDNLLGQNNGLELLSSEYQNAVDALRYDHVDLYYVDFTKMVLRTITYTQGRNVTYQVYLSSSDGEANYLKDDILSEEIDEQLAEIEAVSSEILENAYGSNYQQIQYIHNWLIDNLEYDTTYSAENNRDIYGALINKKVVCEGYAKTFKYLLDKLEIPCILVSGEAENSEGTRENHMWNYVKINEQWYSVDATWDDPITINGNKVPDENRYKYFCQGDNINTNHFLNRTITENGQEFIYPELYHKE